MRRTRRLRHRHRPALVGADHNAADVAFVEALIPSHRAGIELAREASKKPATHVLAEAIIATQQDELARMTSWLTTWGVTSRPPAAPVPTGDPVQALAAHQEQAIELAQTEQAQGSNTTAKSFAEQVIQSRTAEARQLRAAVAPRPR